MSHAIGYRVMGKNHTFPKEVVKKKIKFERKIYQKNQIENIKQNIDSIHFL